jgi:hypothetical protein
MKRVLLLTMATCAWFTHHSVAQEQPGGYHTVTCIKVRDGKTAEYTRFTDESRKVAQAAADSGLMAVGYRLRSVMPAGAAATCDYVLVNVFQGMPPAPSGPEALSGLLKKAGSSMTAADYIARRASLAQLISSEMWRTVIMVGDIQKGDYLYVNHMKVPDMPAYIEMERSIWKPMAESWIKDGSLHGWVVAQPVIPDGTSLKYQAVTVDVMPSWDAAFKEPPIDTTFKQVHADKDPNQVFEKLLKARDLAFRELMVVEDKIVATGKGPSGSGR